MPGEYDYDALLARAQESLPETASEHERFQVPDVDVLVEGKTTVWRNFQDIVDTIRREPQHFLGFLLRELGTAGTIEGRRVVFKGKIDPGQVQDRLQIYVTTYVICSECNRPDTRLIREDRILLIECDACGAHRPVKVKKQAREQEVRLQEGEIYEFMIQDIGKRGDGIAKFDKYIIFVPGTTKGNLVKVKIEKISGTNAFGHVVRE